MLPAKSPDPEDAVQKRSRDLKVGDRLIHRATRTSVDIYPVVTQVMLKPDLVTVKLEHQSWPEYKFFDLDDKILVLTSTE